MTSNRKLFVSLVIFALLLQTPHAQELPPEYLDQGWSAHQRQSWYTTSQGSRLLPLAWFVALELAASNEKLASPSNMRRYGYLADYTNGATLPVGFATDTGFSPDKSTVPSVGMTCAACHTGEIAYQGKRFRVDGAPTLADFETFFDDFVAALKATSQDEVKFDKFAAEVLGPQLSTGKLQLKSELQVQADWYGKLADKNRSSVRYGHGRLDAQGHILNKVSLVVGAQQQLPGFSSDAPASYPFLWYTPKQERVQWNGLVEQPGPLDLGALARNIGQVVGVFASVDVATNKTKYPSSVRRDNIDALEDLVVALKPPQWVGTPLPKLGSLKDGENLFSQHCVGCHNSIDRATGDKVNPDKPLAKMQPFAEIGTDIWLACNTFRHTSKSGHLEGRKRKVITDANIAAVDKTSFLLTNVIIGSYLGYTSPPPGPSAVRSTEIAQIPQISIGSRKRTALQSGDSMVLSVALDPRLQDETDCRKASQNGTEETAYENLSYKGGPLNGIWATSPYLHNGSVPTLADLLLPASQRPPTFHVGGTEFDADRVGFKSGPTDGPFEFRVRDPSGKVIPGNDNAGHEFGTKLDETQRKALLEFLKSL